MFQYGGSARRLYTRFKLLHLVVVASVCIIFTWSVASWLPDSGKSISDKKRLQWEILQLSQKYVQTLAEAQKFEPDGPYSSQTTAYAPHMLHVQVLPIDGSLRTVTVRTVTVRYGSTFSPEPLQGPVYFVLPIFSTVGARWLKWLEREFTDRKVRGSNPTRSASRLPLSRFGQPGNIPALLLPPGGMAARPRKGATAERLFSVQQL
ncbi:hypothetical protein CSKR_107190 [Clonorchis sinensis]|uniref:Uncharacterized protein n=1 Tax=Clonorchis sinensis TaxID=79923 RepID=A0A8T1MZZ1_CLOSI|nr:hypothetical protein CSKR_107190 [Clonorchis sinensis]